MELQPLRAACELMEMQPGVSPNASLQLDAQPLSTVSSAHAELQLTEAVYRLDKQLLDRHCACAAVALGQSLIQPWVLLGFAAFVASLLSTIGHYKFGQNTLPIAVQTALIFGFLALDVAFEARNKYLRRMEVISRFRRKLRGLRLNAGLRGCCGTHGSTSLQGVYAFRDNHWKFIPKMLLVAGDIIVNEMSHRIHRVRENVLPARLAAFFSYSQLPPSSIPPSSRVERTMAAGDDDSSDDDTESTAAYAESAREQRSDSRPPTAALHKELHIMLTKLAIVSLVVVLACNVIRFFTVSKAPWMFLFLTHPSYVIMAALPISLRLFTRVTDLVGNAQLLALIHGLYSADPSGSSFCSVSSLELSPGATDSPALAMEEEAPRPYLASLPRLVFSATVNVDNVGALHVPLRHVLHFAKRIMLSQYHDQDGIASLTYAANLLQSLGSTTVVCCVDKEGLLSEVLPTPEKVLVMKRRQTETAAGLPSPPAPSSAPQDGIVDIDDEPGGPGLAEGLDNPDNPQFFFCDVHQIMNLIVDRTSDNLLKFDDNSWMDFAPVLKPIGLNCLVHALQSLDESEQLTTGHPGDPTMLGSHPVTYDKTVLWGKSMYGLAREIGVTGETITCLKKRIHTLHVAEPAEPPADERDLDPAPPPTLYQMVSLVAEDCTGNWQLLTIGCPEIVLDCCEEYWDGEECARLSTTDRQQLLQQANQWVKGHDLVTLAFSYRPIPEGYRAALEASDRCIFRMHAPFQAPHSNMDSTDGAPDETGEEGPEKLSGDTLFNALEADQIFLGFVGLRHQPRQHVPEFLELFRRAGIRFTYFSPTSEQKTKAFGDRLGLYTDWNCCISLRSRHVSLDATSLKARLPHGIGAIKKHLANVDNVPLLVSLFCDATPLSISRMIRILQSYNEVVCTVGSVLNHNNPHIFGTSHCAISLLPAVNDMLLSSNKAFTRSQKAWYGALGWGTRENGDWASDARSTWQLGNLLSTPCALSLPCVDFPFYALLCMIQRARHLLHAMGRSCQLLVYCNVFVHLLLVCCDVAFLPPVLTGIQTLWLVLIVFPILAGSVFHTRPSGLLKSMADIIPAKHDATLRARILSHCREYFCIQVLPSIPVLLFVFAASLKYCLDIPWIGVFVHAHTPFDDPDRQTPLLVAQNIAAFFVVYWCQIHSMGCLSRHRHLHEFQPWRQVRWIVLSTLALGLQVASGVLSLWMTYTPTQTRTVSECFAALGIEVYCVGFLWPIAIAAVDELAKHRRRHGFKLVQKRLKLGFDTRLGAYSPK